MTRFMPKEYLVANAFVYLTNERFIALDDVLTYCELVQNKCDSNDIDAVILPVTKNGSLDFPDYFNDNHMEDGIILLSKNVTKEELRKKFTYNTPLDIDWAFSEVAKDFKDIILRKH